MMRDAYDGKVVWITGASSGIGEALARDLGALGAKLILSGRNEAALDAVAAACGGPSLVLPFDTTAFADLPAIAAKALAWQGGIDMLVNNAGISQRALALDTEFAVYQRILAVDLLGPIALTQAVLPRMVARGAGRIVMISSVAGKVGVPLRTGYCAAKHGLIGYADALRAEIAGAGVSVHVVAPGSVRTNVAINALDGQGAARGVSDAAIDNGIDPAVLARKILKRVAKGKREIVIAPPAERAMVKRRRRDPEALFDHMADLVAAGYAAQMGAAGEADVQGA